MSRRLKRLKDDNSHANDGNVTTRCKFLGDKPHYGRSVAVINHSKSTEAEDIFLENRGIAIE